MSTLYLCNIVICSRHIPLIAYSVTPPSPLPLILPPSSSSFLPPPPPPSSFLLLPPSSLSPLLPYLLVCI